MSKQLPIENIQIKRIVFDADRLENFTIKLKGFKPKEGEIVQVISPGEGFVNGIKTPFIIIGDNPERSLYEYIEDGDVYITRKNIPEPPTSSNNISDVKPVTVTGTSSLGESTQFAKADHQHTLGIKISSGTGDLPTSANPGDIYIRLST